MIRALFVDAGGVLFNNITEETGFVPEVARRYAVDEHRLLRGVESSAHLYESGRCHVHEVFRRLLSEAGTPRAAEFDGGWLDRVYEDSVRHYERNFDELVEVARRHPKLSLVLTNNEAEHWDLLKNNRFTHFRLFTQLCSSWRVGQVKPSEHYFTEVLRRCRVAAHQALLVDDRPAVIAVGRQLGMPTLHVTRPAVLAESLRALVSLLS